MEQFKIRPYARLLSMMGDQLIKDVFIALTELVKNAYDADANVCNVYFNNFLSSQESTDESNIQIEDDGYGMSKEILTTHFLNPATPLKRIGKELPQSKKGRVPQGEKGIGRFSMFKLGRKVTVFSKEASSPVVHSIKFDFGQYDSEFLSFQGHPKDDLFLDQLSVQYEEKCISDLDSKSTIVRFDHGTIIQIEALNSKWDNNKIKLFEDELIRFTPFSFENDKVKISSDFTTQIFVNDKVDDYRSNRSKELEDIIANKALLKVNGRYDEQLQTISINYSEQKDKKGEILLSIPYQSSTDSQSIKLYGLDLYKSIMDNKGSYKNIFGTDFKSICGPFDFQFFIFDFDAKADDFFGLNRQEKEIVKNYRVFLYRDNVRVQPYGSSSDDWLQIDRTRAKEKAGFMFGNDQIIGQIGISKANNPYLKDKTSREGLIEDSPAFQQMIVLIRLILSYLRVNIFQPYKANEKQKKDLLNEHAEEEKVGKEFTMLKEAYCKDEASTKALNFIQDQYSIQKQTYEKRLNIAEQLAGVGLSVETASHDIMLSIRRLSSAIDDLILTTDEGLITFDPKKANEMSHNSKQLIDMINVRMQGLQQIFVSSKERPKQLDVKKAIQSMEEVYHSAYEKAGISVEYYDEGNGKVIATAIDAVLFQVFINLFDNSLYWLDTFKSHDKKVCIYLDSNKQTVIFSDNGIGVSERDAPFIFEAFYSGKGDEGRGLGLYIARRLLERYDYEINLISNPASKKQPGANFLIDFSEKEEMKNV